MNDEAAAKLPPMPPEIAKAVIAVKRKIERIGKDETNTFAKFAGSSGLSTVVLSKGDRLIAAEWASGKYPNPPSHGSSRCN